MKMENERVRDSQKQIRGRKRKREIEIERKRERGEKADRQTDRKIGRMIPKTDYNNELT